MDRTKLGTRILFAVVMLLMLASSARADVGIFRRNNCQSGPDAVTAPVNDQTWCFDSATDSLLLYTGNAWVKQTGASALGSLAGDTTGPAGANITHQWHRTTVLVTTAMSPYTQLSTDSYIDCLPNTGAVTINLLVTSDVGNPTGNVLTVKNQLPASAACNIVPHAGDTIDGASGTYAVTSPQPLNLHNANIAGTGSWERWSGILPGTTCVNQFASAIDTTGTLTCSSVNLSNSVTGTLPNANGGSGTVYGAPAYFSQISNAGGAIGTTANKLAKVTGNPSTALISTAGDTSGALGIVTAGAGIGGTATIQMSGLTNCVFDNSTLAGDYVAISPSVAGDCHDAGASFPTSGQVLGRVLSTNGSAGTYQMFLFAAEQQGSSASSSGTVTSVGVSVASVPEIAVSGGPITGAGTFTFTKNSESANTFAGGPASGGATAWAFRLLVGADLPNPSSTSLGGIQSIVAQTHKWINSISTLGVPNLVQPACADLSDSSPSCSTDTTNAANISSGTLAAARLPNPSATTIGGVESEVNSAHFFLTGITTLGVVSNAQPDFSDLTGTATDAQLANGYSGTGACAAHKWASTLNRNAIQTCTQPDASDITSLVASATTDTTNASNISSGTLAQARLSAGYAAPTAHSFIIGQGTSAPTALNCASGTFAYGQGASVDPICHTLGAADISGAFGSQTANTFYSAPNGSSGTPNFRTIAGADLPNPSASLLGGTESKASAAHFFLTGISTSGVPSSAQPDFTDLTGGATAAQILTALASPPPEGTGTPNTGIFSPFKGSGNGATIDTTVANPFIGGISGVRANEKSVDAFGAPTGTTGTSLTLNGTTTLTMAGGVPATWLPNTYFAIPKGGPAPMVNTPSVTTNGTTTAILMQLTGDNTGGGTNAARVKAGCATPIVKVYCPGGSTTCTVTNQSDFEDPSIVGGAKSCIDIAGQTVGGSTHCAGGTGTTFQVVAISGSDSIILDVAPTSTSAAAVTFNAPTACGTTRRAQTFACDEYHGCSGPTAVQQITNGAAALNHGNSLLWQSPSWPTGTPITVSGVSWASGLVTATTSSPHGWVGNPFLTIASTNGNLVYTGPVTITGASTFAYPVAATPGAVGTTTAALEASFVGYCGCTGAACTPVLRQSKTPEYTSNNGEVEPFNSDLYAFLDAHTPAFPKNLSIFDFDRPWAYDPQNSGTVCPATASNGTLYGKIISTTSTTVVFTNLYNTTIQTGSFTGYLNAGPHIQATSVASGAGNDASGKTYLPRAIYPIFGNPGNINSVGIQTLNVLTPEFESSGNDSVEYTANTGVGGSELVPMEFGMTMFGLYQTLSPQLSGLTMINDGGATPSIYIDFDGFDVGNGNGVGHTPSRMQLSHIHTSAAHIGLRKANINNQNVENGLFTDVVLGPGGTSLNSDISWWNGNGNALEDTWINSNWDASIGVADNLAGFTRISTSCSQVGAVCIWELGGYGGPISITGYNRDEHLEREYFGAGLGALGAGQNVSISGAEFTDATVPPDGMYFAMTGAGTVRITDSEFDQVPAGIQSDYSTVLFPNGVLWPGQSNGATGGWTISDGTQWGPGFCTGAAFNQVNGGEERADRCLNSSGIVQPVSTMYERTSGKGFQFGLPSGGGKGQGTINVQNGLYLNGSLKGIPFASATMSVTAPTAVGCVDGTVAVAGSTIGMSVNCTPQTNPTGTGGLIALYGFLSAAGTADCHVCNLAVETSPPATTYNVTVSN